MTNADDVDHVADTLCNAIGRIRALAYNLGYLDFPLHSDELPPGLSVPLLAELAVTELDLLNDFVIERMRRGQLRDADVQWFTGPPEADDEP